jgi:hypothetical protein
MWHARSVRRALIVGLVAVTAIAGGCGGRPDPLLTSLFVTIETAPNDPAPDELRTSVFDERGALYVNERSPATGRLMPESVGKLGTVTIYVPATTTRVRLHLRAVTAGATRLSAVKEVNVIPGRQIGVTVPLAPGDLADSDGDSVPDPIDNCPVTPNSDQADQDATGFGDACQSVSDGGQTVSDGGQSVSDGGQSVLDEGQSVSDRGASGDCATDLPADAAAPPDGGAREDGPNDSVPDVAQGGLLTITQIAQRSLVDLTAEGSLDWAHWGATSVRTFEHKASSGGLISDLVQPASLRYVPYPVTYIWSDGTPTTAGKTTAGVYMVKPEATFSLNVVADGTMRTLRLYVGANLVSARLTAHLSDQSAADATFDATGSGLYEVPLEINFRAGAASQSLSLTWAATTTATNGAISIKAATLF